MGEVPVLNLRVPGLAVPIGSIAVIAMIAIAAMPTATDAASPKVVHIIGTEGLGDNVPGGQIYQYKQGRTVIQSGDSITWKNETMDPHTITIVSSFEVELPDKVVAAQNPGFVDGGEHLPPFVPALAAYKPTGDSAMRLEVVGDSIVVAVQGEVVAAVGGGVVRDTATAAIVAPNGSRLLYYCAFHPWMEGRIDVLKKGASEKGL